MRGFHHIGLTVRDLERSLAFYVDVLGQELLVEPTETFAGPELERALGVPGARLRLAVVRVGESALELLEYEAPPSDLPAPPTLNTVGATHTAFRVDDVHATKAALEAKGVRFRSEVNAVDDGPLAGWRWVYFEDPDGYSLELVELAYTRDAERRAAARTWLEARAAAAARS